MFNLLKNNFKKVRLKESARNKGKDVVE